MTEACIQTQWNGIQGMLVDCPHREQAQYLGDSLMQSILLTYLFTDSRLPAAEGVRGLCGQPAHTWIFPLCCAWKLLESHVSQLRMSEYDFDYVEILWQLYWYFDDQDAIRRLLSCWRPG